MRIHGKGNRRLAAGVMVLALLVLAVATAWGQSARATTGTIAYSQNSQLRLIGSNGKNDRLLWAADPGDSIRGLDWRADGGALAFASDVQANCSIYQSDVYTVLADGLGLRRATNSPLCEQTADFPTGTITVKVENQVPDYSAFQLYVQGAAQTVSITVAPGSTETITVKDVADLGGAVAQRVVVIREDTRWYDPAVTVNVVAGQTTAATSTLVLQSNGNSYRDFGAAQPAWRYDGSAVGFVFADAQLHQVAPYPVVAEPDTLLVPDAEGDLLAWSPIDDTVLYAGEATIYLIEPGASGPGTPLVDNPAGKQILGIDWLPDGSGFVFAQTEETGDVANLWLYALASNETTPLTDLTTGFLRHPGVSPDGQAIAFERASRLDSTAELWVMDIDGTSMKPLGVLGANPDWRPQRRVSLFAYFYLPLIGNKIVGIIPSPTPTVTPTHTPTATPTQTPEASPTSPTASATPDSSATPEPTASPTAEPTATVDATATATDLPTVSPTPSATPANLPTLKNGDFDDGPNGDWLETINNVTSPGSLIVNPQTIVIPRSGEYLAWLGGFYNQTHQLSQPVTVTGSAPLYLQFYFQIASNEGTCAVDSAEVLINGSAQATYQLCTAENSTGWERATVDLAPYVGQSVTVAFEGTFDEATLSSFFVDDVSFVKSP